MNLERYVMMIILCLKIMVSDEFSFYKKKNFVLVISRIQLVAKHLTINSIFVKLLESKNLKRICLPSFQYIYIFWPGNNITYCILLYE